MRRPRQGILDAIGNTPLVRIQRIVPEGSADIYAKLEFANPTGSMKDRVAKAMVEAAESDGRLKPGGTVVEYTGGTTGVSLGLVCAAKGYGLKIVFSNAFSDDKRRMMQAFGAAVQDVPSENTQITEKLIRSMVDRAKALGRQPGHWFCDQLSNRDGAAGYNRLGEEVWEQTGGRVDAFVQSVGTAHSIHGTTRALWGHDKAVKVVAVEPLESPVLSGGPTGAHMIEGIGIGYVPPLWRPEMVNEILTVSTREAKMMARRLAIEEGLLVGTSSGANMVAALRVAKGLGSGASVVTIMVDSGLRYMSTDLFAAP